MLKKLRTTLAVIFFACITLLFLDFTGTMEHFHIMAHIQLLPALLATNALVVALLILLTLIFGRIYCSVICPLGVFQDAVAWTRGRISKNRYRYSRAMSWLRYTMLGIMTAAVIAGAVIGIGGAGVVMGLLDPYSAYGRMVTNLLQPVYLTVNNSLAAIAENAGSYAFYRVDVWLRSTPSLIISLVTLAVIVILAWRSGRTYCNTICPVGTLLGLVSNHSLFKVRIDTSKCNGCGLCARNCKASCIDSKNHEIDYSRCMACGDCIGKCRSGALSYSRRPASTAPAAGGHDTPADRSKRSFLLATALTAGAALANEKKKVDGGLAVIEDKAIPERHTPITPPGSLGADNLARHCTGCQLCVAECPNGVLRPSSGLLTLMQPVMSYERGYCRPECTRCSQVCPTKAIRPVTAAVKSSIQIGHAVWIKENCVPLTDGVACGNCARHCPVGAITMVPSVRGDDSSPLIPAVNETRCIGCGACENLCPARPFSAIYVEGHERHREI